MRPAISVVTPSFNQGQFISTCIDSLAMQFGIEIEHIIVDNCSTDQTQSLLEKLSEPTDSLRRRIIVEPDKSQSEAINKGFRLASGDLVCWLNTDEYFLPGVLAKVQEFAETHPRADVIFGDCDFVDKQHNVVHRRREFGYSEGMLLYYGCYIPSCATFFRRAVLERGNLVDESFRVNMDMEFYLRLSRSGFKFAHMPIVVAHFTWHETNLSSRENAQRLKDTRVIQERYARIPGPKTFRSVLIVLLSFSWLAVRVVRRTIITGYRYLRSARRPPGR